MHWPWHVWRFLIWSLRLEKCSTLRTKLRSSPSLFTQPSNYGWGGDGTNKTTRHILHVQVLNNDRAMVFMSGPDDILKTTSINPQSNVQCVLQPSLHPQRELCADIFTFTFCWQHILSAKLGTWNTLLLQIFRIIATKVSQSEEGKKNILCGHRPPESSSHCYCVFKAVYWRPSDSDQYFADQFDVCLEFQRGTLKVVKTEGLY